MRFVCDCCNDITNVEADRMSLRLYNRQNQLLIGGKR